MNYKGLYITENNGFIRILNNENEKKPRITISLSKHRKVLENYVSALNLNKFEALFLFTYEEYSRFCNFDNKKDFYKILTKEDLAENVVYEIILADGQKRTYYSEKELKICCKDFCHFKLDGKYFLRIMKGKNSSENIADLKLYWLPKSEREKRVV